MGAVLRLVDEHFGKGRGEPFELHLASERITARELIGKRISSEIKLLSQQAKALQEAHHRTRSFLIRFDPSSPEAQLNNSGKPMRAISFDEGKELAAAESAFSSNKFVMLFDEKQVEDLDEILTVTATSEVVFLRLVPLIGG